MMHVISEACNPTGGKAPTTSFFNALADGRPPPPMVRDVRTVVPQ